MTEWGGVEHSQTSKTVTDSAVDILSATTVQRDILIQNNHATGIVYINLSGDAVVSGSMFTLLPRGGWISLPGIVNAVSARGSVASNTLVAVSEGNWR